MVVLFLLILALGFAQNEIFSSKLKGIEVQEYNPGVEIDSLTAYRSGEWVFMRAWSEAGFGDIIRIKLKGCALQEFIPPLGYITRFTVSGPDPNGYVHLSASDGSNTGEILQIKLRGGRVQDYSAPVGYCISGFTASGPDGEGWVYLHAEANTPGTEQEGKSFSFALKTVAPNPGTDRIRIFYSIGSSSRVVLSIIDPSGRVVRTLINQDQPPGEYNLSWGSVDELGKPIRAGIYFVRLEADDFKAVKKFVIVK